MTMDDMMQVHKKRLALLKAILEVSDIALNALKVSDIDIVENALKRKAELISSHDELISDCPAYKADAVFRSDDVLRLLKRIEQVDQEAFGAYERMKTWLEAEQAGNRKQMNDLNRRKSIESAYGYGSGGYGGHVLDGKK